ncbi:hypothetical protein GCM10009109_28470 [Marinobacterium sediminicola]
MRIRIYQNQFIEMVEMLCKQTRQTPTQLILSLIEKEASIYYAQDKQVRETGKKAI